MPYRPARWPLWRAPRVCVPWATLPHGGEAGGQQGPGAPGHRVPGLGVGGVCGGGRCRCTLGRALRRALRGRYAPCEAPPLCRLSPCADPRRPPRLAGTAANRLGRACLAAPGPPHRWRVALSPAPRRGLSRGPPATGPVSWRPRARPSGGARRVQRAPAPSGSAPPSAPGPSAHQGGPAGGPHAKAARRARRRVVRLTLSGRPASPAHNRTPAPGARPPWAPPVPGAAGDDGAGVGGRRAPRSDPDGPRQTRPVAAAAPAVHRPR